MPSSIITSEDQESQEQQQILLELSMILSTVQQINSNLVKLIEVSKDPNNTQTIRANINTLNDLMDKLR
ncbi:hypothetical protein Cantr_06021 [Candida viswanathii]|uniref:Uncharacterized protein n=1 Tax=Candida viswanathii TaxID=5486 RepID=A0A367XS97_9ASCO|nr:hypothetical protein Cantr_06021 [Candida viswanathii]